MRRGATIVRSIFVNREKEEIREEERPSAKKTITSRRGGVVRSAFFLGLFFSALFTLLWMLALPRAFDYKVERDTGCSWVADRLSCNPFGFAIRIEDAVLGNAPEFGEGRPMMNIRRFEAKAKLKSLISGRTEVERASLELDRVSLVVDEQGQLNLEKFAKDLFGEARGLGDKMRIAHCSLKIKTVEILDYSTPTPSHKALRLGVDIDDFEAEGALGMLKPLFEIVNRSEYLPEGISGIADSESVISSF